MFDGFLFKLIKGMGMKKILLCALLFLPVAVVADTMCVRDSSLVISLDGVYAPVSGGRSGYVWWADFPDGRVFGEATCLSEQEGLGRTTGRGLYYGVGDNKNQKIVADAGLLGMDADGYERKYCWLRVTHPVSGAWVFAAETCNTCFDYAYRVYVKNDLYVRKGLFESIGL